eukprot:TRINITY_DN12710_c0_g1_i2.p1 TRINITY_DN12710_c0_g1~~TRINITY_DN12710_c0_g1_i2.p1  ORF type:complete len:355 (+),score=66.69 TRINITY_DN12710_c0_g1_i2:69-1133(+)
MAERLASPPRRLIGLLAAHFSAADEGRVERLRRLLVSVGEQTHRVPLLASWSADLDRDATNVAARAERIFQEFSRAGVVRALPRPPQGRLAQFEHYRRLNNVLQQHAVALGRSAPEELEPLLLFSDDDDIWHPRRAEEYLMAAAEQPSSPVLASRVHASPGLCPRLPAAATAADVSRGLERGELRLAVAAERAEPGLFGTATGEYFDAAASASVLADFFRTHNDRVAANPFADIRFRTFMLKQRGVHRFLPDTQRSWMYFYDRPTEPYTTSPTEEDHRYLCPELPDLERIAGMRQTLDCVLFQLVPTEGPLRISEREFAEQLVGILVEQGRATVRMALDRCQLHGVSVLADDNA